MQANLKASMQLRTKSLIRKTIMINLIGFPNKSVPIPINRPGNTSSVSGFDIIGFRYVDSDIINSRYRISDSIGINTDNYRKSGPILIIIGFIVWI